MIWGILANKNASATYVFIVVMATGVSLTKTDDIATIIGDNIMVVVTLMTVFLFFVFFAEPQHVQCF